MRFIINLKIKKQDKVFTAVLILVILTCVMITIIFTLNIFGSDSSNEPFNGYMYRIDNDKISPENLARINEMFDKFSEMAFLKNRIEFFIEKGVMDENMFDEAYLNENGIFFDGNTFDFSNIESIKEALNHELEELGVEKAYQ